MKLRWGKPGTARMFPKRNAWTRLPVPIFIPFGVRKALMATATDFLLLKIGWLSQRFAASSERCWG